jgi:hypothetical protein
VGGKVGTDTSPVSGDPAATIAKAQVIEAAANAPVDPSAQDKSVAAAAAAMEQAARQELAKQQRGAGTAALVKSAYGHGTDAGSHLLPLTL